MKHLLRLAVLASLVGGPLLAQSTEQLVNDSAVSPSERNSVIQKAVSDILSTYPPR